MNSQTSRRPILLTLQSAVAAPASDWPVHEEALRVLAKLLVRAPAPGVTPALGDSTAAVQRLVALAHDTDRQHGENAKLDYDDLDASTDEALAALAALHAASTSEANPAVPALYAETLDRLALAIAHWAMRHGVRCIRIEPVVNALARTANAAQTRQETAAAYALMQGLIEHCRADFAADLERSNPERPWRILNLNFAITAIRSGDIDLMRFAFAALGTHLPDESRAFLAEAAAMARTAGLPQEARELIERELQSLSRAQ